MTHLVKRFGIRSPAIVVLSGIVLGLALFAVRDGARPAKGQLVDLNRAALIQQFFATQSNGNVDGAVAFVADNASWIGGSKCPATNPCQGVAAVRQNVDASVAAHTSFTITSIQMLGSVVIGRVQLQNDASRAAGLGRLSLTFFAQIPRDKITVWVLQTDLTDPQAAAFASNSPAPGAAPAPASPADLDQMAVILRHFDALNRGDVDAYMADEADNSFAITASPRGLCSLAAPCYDKDSIRQNVELTVRTPNLCETVTNIETIGGFVTGRLDVRSDNVRVNGIERNVQAFIAQVQDGKIIAYFGRNDLSDPQSATNAAINAGQQVAGAPIPTPNPVCG